jgi:hypothetical protein
MTQVAPETIEPPAKEHVEPPSLRIRHELVERGAAILRPAHPLVDVFL